MQSLTRTAARVAVLPFLAALIAFAAVWAPSANAQDDPDSDIVDTAIAAGSFTTLVDLVVTADLADALRAEGPLTVFAPTDDAFAAVPADVLTALAADVDLLTEVLLYHVVAGDVRAAEVVGLTAAPTLQGESIAIDASAGVVLDGSVNVVTTDIVATNGVIHVVDGVLIPESVERALAGADIVDTAIAAGSFTTLVDLVVAADLADALRGEGPLTVFAPTDDAFAAVPADVLAALAADVDLLTEVLLYHVVAGDVRADEVVRLSAAPTLQGEAIAIDASAGVVLDGGANVVATDIVTTNGVIHVIDAVLIPASVANALAADEVDVAANGGEFIAGLNAVAVISGGDVAAGAVAVAIEAASGRTVTAIWSLESGEWRLYAPGPIDFGLSTVGTPAALFVVLS